MTNQKCDLEERRHGLLFGIRRSIRYHSRRRRFFDKVNKFSTFLTALGGTATIASVLAEMGRLWTLTFATSVAVFSAVDLVVGTAQAARLHDDLSRDFINLEKEFISIKDFTEDDYRRLSAIRLEIEAKEPPVYKVLDAMCHNELCRALGYHDCEHAEIKWYQRLFCHLIDIQEHNIKIKGNSQM
jgi:hypothetical protein